MPIAGIVRVAEDVMARCLSLPMFPEMTEQHITRVVSVLQECVQSQFRN